MEKRSPIAIIVELNRLHDQSVFGKELTYTDNISSHGARVFSCRYWQKGELVQMTPIKGRAPIQAKIAYCQKLADGRYGIGLNFRDALSTAPICSLAQPFQSKAARGT